MVRSVEVDRLPYLRLKVIQLLVQFDCCEVLSVGHCIKESVYLVERYRARDEMADDDPLVCVLHREGQAQKVNLLGVGCKLIAKFDHPEVNGHAFLRSREDLFAVKLGYPRRA